VVAFSFGMRGQSHEPNPCNVRLARAAERIIRDEPASTLLISQWEIARQLSLDEVHVDQVVRPSSDREYLDTSEVWNQALETMRREKVETAIPVAQPFLHRHKIRKMIRDSGIAVERRRIGWIGFDSSEANLQWWTKGPVRLLAYSIMQVFGRHPGPAANLR
jgi:hypothetical protein